MPKRARRQALEEKIRAQVEAEVKAKAEAEGEAKTEAETKAKAKAKVEVKDTNTTPKSDSAGGATTATTGTATNKRDTSMTSEELAALIKQLANETTRFQNEVRGVTANHEQRIVGCENGIEECKRRISNLESGQPVSVAPVAQPKADPVAPISNPVAQPAVPVRAPQVIAGLGRNGAGKAYKYWRAGAWGLTSDIWAAKQAGNGEYDIIWVWYVNDHIDHLLSEEEMQRHLPH